MENNLIPDLLPAGVEDDELLQLLLNHYGSARSTPDNDVEYPNTDKFALQVRSKSGEIKDIEPGPGFSEEEFAILKDKVASQLVVSPATKIERTILFSSHPVKGCFRSDSNFQICAAPANAPQPGPMIADHPFVFEFPLRQSSDALITIQRRTRKTLEWTWFLNAVLRTRIRAIGPRTDYHWSLCGSGNDTPTQAKIKWAQEFYMIDGFKTQGDGFSACVEPKIPTIPYQDYYGVDVYRWGEFVVPDNLDALVGAFANLKPEDRFRFLRACQWVYVAHAHWVTHASSFYIALVAAIESLLPAAPTSEKCPACGRDKGPGPTQLFQDFVEAHTKGETASNRKPLYALRSKLAHGGGLLQLDERPWTFSFNTSALQERERWTELVDVVRAVLINWLLASDRKTSAQSHQVLHGRELGFEYL
jgi:hypothetical protein